MSPGEKTLPTWARRHRQTQGAIRRFWEPILQSALNDDLDRISVHYAGKVIRDSFLSSVQAGAIGVPLLPLSEMYQGASEFVAAHGGAVRLRASVTGLQPTDEATVGSSRSRTGDERSREQFDAVVLALPPDATARLVSPLPWNHGKTEP